MADDEKDYNYYRLKLFDAYVVQIIERGQREENFTRIDEALKKIKKLENEEKILIKRIEEILRAKKPSKDENSPEKQDPVNDTKNKNLTSEKPQVLDVHFSKRRLFVVGFQQGTTEQELQEYFSQFGAIEDISLFTQKNYAYVTFECYYKIPPFFNMIKGRTVEAHFMSPRNDPKLKTKTILVNGLLTDEISEDSMAKYFSKYGKVNNVNLKKNGLIKRFAFVIFDKQESVEKAVETPCHLIDGKLIDIRKAREN